MIRKLTQKEIPFIAKHYEKIMREQFKKIGETPITKGKYENILKENFKDSFMFVLDEKEISKLIEIAKSVEAYYGPQIIEWCQERGRIFLLQIKPLVPTIQNEEQQENGKLLYSGYPTSSGFAKGRVKIVRSFEDMESKEGCEFKPESSC